MAGQTFYDPFYGPRGRGPHRCDDFSLLADVHFPHPKQLPVAAQELQAPSREPLETGCLEAASSPAPEKRQRSEAERSAEAEGRASPSLALEGSGK